MGVVDNGKSDCVQVVAEEEEAEEMSGSGFSPDFSPGFKGANEEEQGEGGEGGEDNDNDDGSNG